MLVEAQLPFLTILSSTKSKKLKRQLVDSATSAQLNSLCEVCFNLLQGRLEVSKDKLQKLKKYKNHIRKLAGSKKKSLKSKRQILVQNGGFLPLLATLLPSVIGLVTSLVKRKSA